ncbi:MAG: glycosyltransferase family 4 protein [Bacteroidales bacterium]
MKRNKVMIDCEKIKHPNTGLFSFCTQLTNAIERIKNDYSLNTNYLVTKKCLPFLPENTQTRILHIFNKIYFKVSNDIDIFHATFQLGKYIPSNKKVLLTIHDLNFLYEKKPRKAKRLHKWVQRNIDKADYLIAISEYTKQDIIKHLNINEKPLDVIYNGCSFYTGTEITNPSYKPVRKFIFTVGTVLPKKNFHVLPALLEDNDYELLIAGNKSAYIEKILEEAAKYNVADRVKILGPVSEEDKDWYYRNCSAFVFPSIAEGFGLPVIEALHYGKPTFISQHTSLPEIGKDYCFYFDYNFDPEKMKAEFKQGMDLFNQRDINQQIEYAHSYSWDNAARKYCEIYNKLILK